MSLKFVFGLADNSFNIFLASFLPVLLCHWKNWKICLVSGQQTNHRPFQNAMHSRNMRRAFT